MYVCFFLFDLNKNKWNTVVQKKVNQFESFYVFFSSCISVLFYFGMCEKTKKKFFIPKFFFQYPKQSKNVTND